MSAAPGTEALDVEVSQAGAVGPEHLVIQHSRLPARPVTASPRVTSLRVPQLRRSASSPVEWAQALQLRSLPTSLLGATVALLLVLGEPAVRVAAAGVAVAGLVVLHLVGGLLRALADPRRGCAGPLRRVEAGRALLGLAAVGLGLTIALAVTGGWPALLLAPAGVALVFAWRGPSALVSDVALAAGAGVSCAAVWWAAAGSLSWKVLLPALTAWLLVAALRSTSTSRALLAAPCVAVGVAVALHALPWPALLVAVSLPAARHAVVAGRPATAPGRLAVLLLLVGLAVALATGTDLPLTAAR